MGFFTNGKKEEKMKLRVKLGDIISSSNSEFSERVYNSIRSKINFEEIGELLLKFYIKVEVSYLFLAYVHKLIVQLSKKQQMNFTLDYKKVKLNFMIIFSVNSLGQK